MANTANNVLARALDAKVAADQGLARALDEQQKTMRALAAVFSTHSEAERGRALASRAGVRS